MSNPLFVIQETGCVKRLSFLRPNVRRAIYEYIYIYPRVTKINNHARYAIRTLVSLSGPKNVSEQTSNCRQNMCMTSELKIALDIFSPSANWENINGSRFEKR